MKTGEGQKKANIYIYIYICRYECVCFPYRITYSDTHSLTRFMPNMNLTIICACLDAHIYIYIYIYIYSVILKFLYHLRRWFGFMAHQPL